MVFGVYGMDARGLFIKVGDTVSASVLVWPLEWNNYPIRFIIFNLKKKKLLGSMSVREGKTSHINGICSQKVGYALKN